MTGGRAPTLRRACPVGMLQSSDTRAARVDTFQPSGACPNCERALLLPGRPARKERGQRARFPFVTMPVGPWRAAGVCARCSLLRPREAPMDVILTILIGLAAGLLISVLAPDLGPRTPARTGGRRIRGMVAGMLGALAVASLYVRLHGSGNDDGLTMALIAL